MSKVEQGRLCRFTEPNTPTTIAQRAITTIAQETHVAGAILVEKLIQRLEGGKPASVILPTQLVERAT